MKIAIIYASLTGNTKQLSEKIKETCINEDITFYGTPLDADIENITSADLIFVGSWTDKGNCCTSIKDFLKKLNNKSIAIFGTAGFGGSIEYFKKLEERMTLEIPESNQVLGAFYCQGKMPFSVRDRYSSMIKENPEDKNLLVSLKNFDEALSHPESKDLANVEAFTKEMLNIRREQMLK